MTFGVFSERACSVRMSPSSQAGDILELWIRPGLGIGGGADSYAWQTYLIVTCPVKQSGTAWPSVVL